MTIQEFEALLRESGLDDATVTAMVKNEKLTARASSLRQGSEYTALEQRAQQLQAEGDKARNYQAWYEKNYPAVLKLQQDAARYQERYGNLDEAPRPDAAQVTEATVRKLIAETVQESFQKNYGPQVVNTITGVGTVLEKHMRRNRKDLIDWKKMDELTAKTNGNIEAAYDEYDKPNLDADRETELQKRVDAKVKETLAARGTNDRFPAGADGSPSSRSPLSKDEGPKAYDRSRLLETFVSGEYKGFGVTQ